MKMSITNITNYKSCFQDQEMADVIFKEGISDSKMEGLKRIMEEMNQRYIDYILQL